MILSLSILIRSEDVGSSATNRRIKDKISFISVKFLLLEIEAAAILKVSSPGKIQIPDAVT